MDRFLAWLGGVATLVAWLMVVPAAYVVVPWLLALVGGMPMSSAEGVYRQVEPFVLPFLGLWVVMAVLIVVGRSADKRLTAESYRNRR